MKPPTLIAVVGTTAIGKTQLAIALAQHFGTEVVSADSRQFYKEMTIGTAVPSKHELAAVPHHFIQHKSIFERYSVGDFEREALKKLQEIFKTKNTAVMVGGSGLYIDAVVSGLDDFPNVDPEIRTKLNTILTNKGIEELQVRLQALDTSYYEKVDVENPHRLIRALEICIGTGKPYSSFLNKKKTGRPFKTITVALNADRKIIYDRINQRVDEMMKRGLLEEAEKLYEHRHLMALQTVGYKELFQFIGGAIPLELAISEIKKNTRRFAKRQLTWFKRNEDTLWLDYQVTIDHVLKKIEEVMKKSSV